MQALPPAFQPLLFIAASFFIIWRLERLKERGLESSAIGTLISPYCSGLGNILFVVIVFRTRTPGSEVIINSLVNNITNITLLLGLPAMLWGLEVFHRKSKAKHAVKTGKLTRLALVLTTVAALFFTAVLWFLGRDGSLNRGDGLTLIALFVFWQFFAFYDVLKGRVERGKSLPSRLWLESLLVLAGGWLSYVSLEATTEWLSSQHHGFFSARNLGWLTAWLMVLPNAILALYYAARKRADMVYSSQLGDGHICIPFCVGLSAYLMPTKVPAMFGPALLGLGLGLGLHLLALLTTARISRTMGAVLLVAYAVFVGMGFGA